MEAGISIKLCKQFHYSLSNAHRISAVSCFIYMSVLSTSPPKNMDPYIQSLHKRINWQFKYEAFNYVFSSDISYCRTSFYTKKKNYFWKNLKANLYVTWILIKYSNRVEQKACIILFLLFTLFSCKVQQANNLKNINSFIDCFYYVHDAIVFTTIQK